MHDKLYKELKKPVPPFLFDEKVASIFDDMLVRSIPFYLDMQKVTAQLIKERYKESGIIYDLGCSIGTSIIYIATELDTECTKIIGVDNSSAMVEKCEKRVSKESLKGNIKIKQADILKEKYINAEIFLMHYTLQFLTGQDKERMLKIIYEALPKNGVLIISEKMKQEDNETEKNLTHIYYQFKKKQGYSGLEISQKREALENVLQPLSYNELNFLVQKVGFSMIMPLFQWLNFGTFLVVK